MCIQIAGIARKNTHTAEKKALFFVASGMYQIYPGRFVIMT